MPGGLATIRAKPFVEPLMTRLLTAILALVAPVAALAGAVDDAQVALERGEYAAALSILDNHVRENDEDAQGRFLRGLTLVLMDRDDEATQAFANLVRDYPDLPEPYNNLAVLYARAGKYELAMDALETALIKHPSYATAHENLGDVYATLAQAAWKRAQVLDRDSGALEGKLSLISQALAGGVISADASPAVALDAPPPAREPVAAAPQSQTQPQPPVAATQPQGTAQPGPVDTAQERRTLIPVPQMAPIIDGAPAAPATQPRAVRTPPPAASRDAALAALQGHPAPGRRFEFGQRAQVLRQLARVEVRFSRTVRHGLSPVANGPASTAGPPAACPPSAA